MATSERQLLDALSRTPFVDSTELALILGEPNATVHHLGLLGPLQHEPQTAPHDRARHRQTPISGVGDTPLMPSGILD